MWVMFSDTFLSIVADTTSPTRLLVRARVQGDIERVFKGPRVKVRHTPEADYPFRLSLPRRRVAEAMRQAVGRIDYANFKNSVEDDERHDAYLDVWHRMRAFQLKKAKAALPAAGE